MNLLLLLASTTIAGAQRTTSESEIGVIFPDAPTRGGIEMQPSSGPWKPHSTPFPLEPHGEDPRAGHTIYTASAGSDHHTPQGTYEHIEWPPPLKTKLLTRKYLLKPPKQNTTLFSVADEKQMLIPSIPRGKKGCGVGYFPYNEAPTEVTETIEIKPEVQKVYANKVLRQMEEQAARVAAAKASRPVVTPPPKCSQDVKFQNAGTQGSDPENRDAWPIYGTNEAIMKGPPSGTKYIDCNPVTRPEVVYGYPTEQLKPEPDPILKVRAEVKAEIDRGGGSPAQRKAELAKFEEQLKMQAQNNEAEAPEAAVVHRYWEKGVGKQSEEFFTPEELSTTLQQDATNRTSALPETNVTAKTWKWPEDGKLHKLPRHTCNPARKLNDLPTFEMQASDPSNVAPYDPYLQLDAAHLAQAV